MVTVISHVILHHQSLDLDAVGLEGAIETAGCARRRHPVVAGERVGQDQYLSAVGGIRQRLDITGHAGIEHYFANDRRAGSEALAGKAGAVFEDKNYGRHLAPGS